MAYSTKKIVEVNGKKCWRVEIWLDENTRVDRSFTISYFSTRNGKVYFKPFEIQKDGTCTDPNCRVKREGTGVYIIYWNTISEKQNVTVTVGNTVKELLEK